MQNRNYKNKVKRNTNSLWFLIRNVTALFQTTLQHTYEPARNAQITNGWFVLGTKMSKQNRKKRHKQKQQLQMKTKGQISCPGQFTNLSCSYISPRRGGL